MSTSARREEFAEFLSSRRARLRPEDVGLPRGARRRVAGLRREEVAQLAGVGLTWYTWLEQGRPIAASEQVLTSIARALLLSDDERDHLFALAGAAIPERAPMSCLNDSHHELLAKLMPYPAAAQTARFDIVAYNRSYRYLFTDFDRIRWGSATARGCCSRLRNGRRRTWISSTLSGASPPVSAPPTAAIGSIPNGSASSRSSRTPPRCSGSSGPVATSPVSATPSSGSVTPSWVS